VIVAFIINGATAPISAALLDLLPWLLEWFEMCDISMLSAYPRPALMITFVLFMLRHRLLTLPKKGIKSKKFNFSSRQDLCLDEQKLNFFRRTHY